MLMASLFLVLGTAWAQVVEGQAYFLKVVDVDNAYIDAKTNKGGNRGGTIGVSSMKIPVYFKKVDDKWKISTNASCEGGFLKVNEWDVNPQQDEGTIWTIELADDGKYRLKQSDFTTSDGPYLGCENLSATVNLYSNRPVGQAVKIQFEEAYKIELTTDANNPKWYTIKNVRGNAYVYYNGNTTAMGMSGTIDKAAYLFYFTEGLTPGTYKIHNSVNSNLCAAPNSWTADGIDWYIKPSGNATHPGLAISNSETLTSQGNEAWNDYQNNHTSVAWYGGDDAGSTWDIARYEYSDGLPTIQLSTEGNIILHYIRSIRQDSYVNFDGHNVKIKEGAQNYNSYWYFVQDTEAQKDAPEGFIACKIFNAAHATGVENHSSGFMGTEQWPARTYYIGTHVSENDRNGYVIYRPDANLDNNGCWHDEANTQIIDYKVRDDGSHWRIYPAGKTGADLMSEATTAKTNALSTIALYESADYYTYSDAAIAAAKTAIEGINTAVLHSAVAGFTSIPAAVTALEATERGTAGPANGQYIRLKNKHFGGYLTANSDNEKIGQSNDKTNLATLWKVEAGTANGSVKLKNVGNGKYIGEIVRDNVALQKDETEASDLTFSNVTGIYAAFQTTGGDDYSFGNHNSWQGGILGWEKNDAASQWVMSQAYPLTVVYKLGEEELTDLRVEKIVEPGTVYTIENTDDFINDFKEIKSCVVNGNEITADAGVWTVTVNGATTVTVTIAAPEITTRPYYALKSVTGTYLGLTPKATGLVADGVYTIQGDANGARGYMAAGNGFAEYPILSGITLSGHEGNSVEAIENGKNWYVYTTAVGTYIYNIGLGKFLAQEWGNINFSDTPTAWNIKQNGSYTSIFDDAVGKYLSMGCGRTAANRPVQWDTNKDDGGAQHTFTAVTEGDYTAQITAAQAAIAKVSVSFQDTPLYLYYTPTADGATFEYKDEPGKYLGFDANWNVVNAQSAWTIQDADYEGYSYIVRAADATKHLGSDANTNVGTGIFSNVGSSCNKWALEGVYANYATTTTKQDNKHRFTSERLFYAGACNILRFTLTGASAYYNNDQSKLRMSFDSFVLYDAYGQPVALTADNFTGNNTGKDFGNMLDGVNNTYCAGTWADGTASDWFEIQVGDIDLGGAFSFSFVTENGDHFANPTFDIAMSYKSNSYKLNIVAPYGTVVNATYNGEAIAHGDIIRGGFDQTLLEIADIENFAYTVTVDGRVVTIEFVQTGAIVNPASVVALINRIGGTNTANNFKFVLDPSLNLDQETFVIGGEEGKILIKGTTISAITTGLGWYLNNIAHINIAWNSLNEKTTTVKWDANAAYADLSYLPVPTTEETHSSDAKYRYYLNYCTFGYSMTSWTWTRWQQEIDWMALHGINMPLQIVGLEEVWRKFLTMEDANGNRKYNYSDSEAKAFVAGPAFTAWWGMNNLEGWGGTSADGWGGVQDDAWYDRQQALATQILTLQRELGMQPVLPGFSGMVPSNFKDKTGVDCNAGTWGGFTRPKIVLPSNARFAEIAADYYACLKEVMGESQYYSMDPFHEGDEANATKEAYTAIYDAMETAKSGSQWVIQQWQWYGGNQTYSLQGVPAGKLIVLDLFSDGRPEFDKHGYNGYAPQDAVFCAIPNFGGRSGLMGRLQNVTDNYFKYKNQYTTIKGIGTAPEAIEQTPVTYDLIYQLPWMNGVKPDVAAWVDNYAVARYGKDNAVVKEAWSLLRQGPLNYGADAIQGPVEDVWAARPNLDASPASSWGTTLNGAGGTYTPARRQMLIDAVYKLIDQEDELELTNSVYRSNYLYDLVEFGGAVMADYAYDLLKGIKAAKDAEGTDGATYKARRNAFLQLILDMDAFRGTNLNFRLGKWTQEARDAAAEVTGATTATPDWYEFNNARTILTTWGDQSQNGGLKDYSYRSWQGLLADYYYPRWKYYFDNNCNGPSSGYFFFEWNWAHGMEHSVGQTSKSTTRLAEGAKGYSYSRDPEGNTVEEAVKMLGKYIIPVAMADGTHYAYRYLTNDLSSKVTIIAVGNSIDLTQYFGALQGATVTGDFIEGTATDLANISLKANLDGAYTGTITLADGTVLTFGVTANPQYYGAYQIKFNGDPVFIQYNVGGDNGGSVGYKVMGATGFGENGNDVSTGLTADYEADKIFTIVPSGVGYTLSAQGQYLKTTASSGWAHIMFSDQKGDAGTYTFTEDAGLVKLKSTNTSGNASVAIYGNGAWGNDVDGKAKGFTFTKVENYAITIPEGGLYTVCLPFNVVLPTGVTAYDVTVAGLTSGDDGAITTLATIATEGQILKAGTPAVLKATAGNYTLAITMDNADAKTSSPESKLRGNFVKQTLQPGTNGVSKFVLVGDAFELLSAEQDIPANTCWIEAKIDAEHVEVTEHEGKIVKVDDWLFEYDDATNGIKLKNVVTPGDGNLEIKETFTVNGKTQKVVAITPDFMHGNTDVTEITLPSSLVNLGFRKVNHLFTTEYAGKPGNGVVEDTEVNPVTGKIEKQGMHDCLIFPVNKDEDASAEEYGKPFKIGKDYAWKLTLDVAIDTTGNKSPSFNEWGSAIVSTKPNSLDDYYQGYMQIFLRKDLQKFVVKIDNADDRYTYSTPALDENGEEISDSLHVNANFKFELEHDGSGGYQVVVYYSNGKAKMYNITASENNKVQDFDRLYFSLPEGINVKVTFERLTNEGLFVGCTNLKRINVHPNNPTFRSCDHGVLYDKNMYYVMRIPEGGDSHYSIPSKVVRLYPGAIHDVKADIVLHSNPQIGVVEGHDEHVKNAKFYLSLDDIDNTITANEKGYGGARDFTSTNANTYVAANYKRAPLAEGEYGTICLPFVATNWKDKYDFFEMTAADATSFHFSPVDSLEAQKAYLYKLKEGVEPDGEEMEMEDGLDVFEGGGFTVETLAKYDPNDEKAGGFRALGAYVNNYIETIKYPNSAYYYFNINSQKFIKVTKKLNYRPYRAIFVVTPEKEGQAAQAPARLGLRIGGTTEIDPSQIEGWEEDVYYDLQGRRVENPTQGIYIVNGKKVIVK